ncbi:histone deacetylase family protein [Oceanispirochaeta crateris]|uniref:Histone deacetylase family protein n=1 Tax=Oceanispirochaeta crateris TaxID=2518645 RepID=A0A5C1QJL8_9SPIO|nr:histone deacetylase family protein [Oceanispirochaeta crateris]QEN08333.1 histone deacetylase family protein [Oceanispirochaeta crateris]
MSSFKIRKVTDSFHPSNTYAIEQVFEILRIHFPSVKEDKINEILEQMKDPLKYQFSSTLFVAEGGQANIKGFAILFYMPDANYCFLDYIAVKPGRISSGVGGAIYERIREEAQLLNTVGIFMECLPDDESLCKDKSEIKQNRARLAFYERYGARPIINTKYETCVNPEDDCPPYLVFDDLGNDYDLTSKVAKKIVKTILQRKYPVYCPEEYIKMIVSSIKDNPVQLREYKYRIKNRSIEKNKAVKNHIPLIINDKHEIHHIKEKGYIESPVRISSITKEITKLEAFQLRPSRAYPDKYILEVHNPKYFNYFKRVCSTFPEGKSIYPYVFPVRNATRPPGDLSVLAGYYCIDTFTPLNKNAFIAARSGVNCSLTGAELLLEGYHTAYALVRPPGHHAERDVFGGFCYFNNSSISAHFLSEFGKVAILDIDYHHGNGHQQIFYSRKDVLTVSIHGNPSFAYPYFTGFTEETGEGEGEGFNLNLPLKENLTGAEYLKVLIKALKRIKEYKPDYLIISLGLDIAKGDPTGTWSLTANDFKNNGIEIGKLAYPVLFVQEGGYYNRTLGINARNFFEGFLSTRVK